MTDDDKPQIELPRYKCHKEVWALKIKEIKWEQTSPGPGTLYFEDERYAPLEVDDVWIAKHEPLAGGYFVMYEGGYKSWSPAEAFEAGYKLIEGSVS